MDTFDVQEIIQRALEESGDDNIRCVMSFDAAGIIANQAGLVINVEGGREFQVTIVRSL